MIIQTAITNKTAIKISQNSHTCKYCIYLLHPYNLINRSMNCLLPTALSKASARWVSQKLTEAGEVRRTELSYEPD
jgi:hypothetical protein